MINDRESETKSKRVLKGQTWSLSAHFWSTSRFWRRGGENEGKELGFARDQALV